MKCCPGLNADVNVNKDFKKVFNVMLFEFPIALVIAETEWFTSVPSVCVEINFVWSNVELNRRND
jgi:hypothetical protein